MTTRIGRTLWLLAGIGVLSAAGTPTFAQSVPPGWVLVAPAQTLGPTGEEMFPVPDAPPATLFFGAALVVDNGTALIGMPGYPGAQDAATEDEGAVAIFTDGSGSWVRTGTLRANDAAAGDFFGERVALLGNLAAVQAESGIYVFRRGATGWSQIQKIVPPANTHFDGGLAVGGATIFVGAPAYGGPGAVFVFEPDLKGVWHPIQTLAPRGQAADFFGGAIAVAGGTLVIGASGDFGGFGAAFIYVKRRTLWSVQQTLAPTDDRTGASFGAAVAVSGARIVVGAPEANTSASEGCFPPSSGAVYVYAPRGGVWERQTKIATPAPDCAGEFSTALFGIEVSVSAAHVVGATPSEFPGEVGGVFDFDTDGAAEVPAGEGIDPSIVSTPVLSLSGKVLFVGLPNDRGFSTGIAEVFNLGDPSKD